MHSAVHHMTATATGLLAYARANAPWQAFLFAAVPIVGLIIHPRARQRVMSHPAYLAIYIIAIGACIAIGIVLMLRHPAGSTPGA